MGLRESLEHEDGGGGSADEAETSLEAGGSAGRLGQRVGAGGRGAQGLGDGHAAGGLDDQGGVEGAGAGNGRGGANALDGRGVGGDGGHNGAGDDDGARLDNGRGALDGVVAVAVATGNRGGDGGGGGVGRAGDRGGDRGGGGVGRLGGGAAVVLGDTELSRVLVLAVDVVNQLETVVGDIGLEVGRGSPGEGARVGDADSEGSAEGKDVGRGAAEQDQRDGVLRGGLPGDLEGLAGRDNLGKHVSRVFGAGAARQRGKLTSIRGRVMGLPAGSPTGACWAAAALTRKATTEALENMLFVVWY
jgi:hypothetical protein